MSNKKKKASSSDWTRRTDTGTGVLTASAAEQHESVSDQLATIRLQAYQKWEQAGKPQGDGLQFWLEAERELSKKP